MHHFIGKMAIVTITVGAVAVLPGCSNDEPAPAPPPAKEPGTITLYANDDARSAQSVLTAISDVTSAACSDPTKVPFSLGDWLQRAVPVYNDSRELAGDKAAPLPTKLSIPPVETKAQVCTFAGHVLEAIVTKGIHDGAEAVR